jgi:hypothetical protein
MYVIVFKADTVVYLHSSSAAQSRLDQALGAIPHHS